MKATTELSEMLRQACKEVDSWHDWQRSNDSQTRASADTVCEKSCSVSVHDRVPPLK